MALKKTSTKTLSPSLKGPKLASLRMEKCLPLIRRAFEAQSLLAQTDLLPESYSDVADRKLKYVDNNPISVCLSQVVRETLDHYWPEVWWSVGIATYASEGIIEVAEEELLDFATLQYIHQAWYLGSDKEIKKAWFEQTLWELEDKYLI